MKQRSSFLLRETKTVKDALDQFERNSCGVVFIVDSKKRLLGTLTDGDVRRALLKGKSLSLSVRLVMNPDPIVFTASPTDHDIYKVFREGYVRYVPLVNQHREVTQIIDITRQVHDTIKKPTPHQQQILVVGGAGYIGSMLTHQLLSAGYNVRVFDSLLYGDASLDDCRTNESFSLLVGDTRVASSVVEALKDIDAVVHLGEIVGDPACSLDEDYTLSVNLKGTQQLVDLCKAYRVPRFIYASSCSVYGFGNKIFSEKSEKHPVSLYGRTKIACETYILSCSSEYFHPTILRFSTVFGWSYRPRFDLVVNAFSLAAVKKEPITVYGGAQWRPFVHVKDVVAAIMTVLTAPVASVSGEIFNVGTEEMNKTLQEVAAAVKKCLPETKIKTVASMKDPRSYRVDFAKIRTLGIIPKYTLKQGVQELVSQVKKIKGNRSFLKLANNALVLQGDLSEE